MKLEFTYNPTTNAIIISKAEGITEEVTISFEMQNNDNTKKSTKKYKEVELEVPSTIKETKTTTKKSTKKTKAESTHVILEDNKLVLPTDLVDKLEAESGESRITVSYKQVNGKWFPLISLSEKVGKPSGGNKLTKSNTIAFRGEQNDKLKLYGNKFEYRMEKEGIYALIGDGCEVNCDTSVFDTNIDEVRKNIVKESKADDDISLEMFDKNTNNEANTKKTYVKQLSENNEEVLNDLSGLGFEEESDYNLEDDDDTFDFLG